MNALNAAGLKSWLIGGNAIEVLCGGNVRDHDDLDLMVRASDGAAVIQLLQELGFAHAHGSLDAGDVFYKRGELLVDIVPVLEAPPRTVGKLSTITWPADFLTEYFAEVDGVPVRTLTPAMHAEMKRIVAAFYKVDMRGKDRLDLAALATLRA